MILNWETIKEKFKKGPVKYNEDVHCKLLIEVMTNKNKGTLSAFCVEAMISDKTFYKWLNENPILDELYSFLKMFSRQMWEDEGRVLKDIVYPMGSKSDAFEWWKLIGWSRFGISKNSRIKLNLKPEDSPDKHYAQLLKQASEGDFTAAEIKQLMEAVNVGLNTHQVFALQKEIDQLKSDLATMKENSDAYNSSPNKGIA